MTTSVAKLVYARHSWMILILTLGACGERHAVLPTIELTGQTMGTTYSVKLIAPDRESEKALLGQLVTEVLTRVDQRMSTWKPDSELSLFNASPSTDWIETTGEFCDVIAAALAISEFTSGAFDITIGPLVNLWGFGPGERESAEPPSDELISSTAQRVGYQNLQTDCRVPAIRKNRADIYVDLSAYAKGYAVDQVTESLDEEELDNYLVEVGGELRMRGNNASGNAWAVAVEKPADFERTVQIIVHLTNHSMATSGDYRNFYEFEEQRYSHTIDSRTGRPVAHNAAAVTVVSDTAAMADALATALLVLGPDEGFRFAEQEKIAAYFLLREESKIEERATAMFAALLTP